MNGKSCNLMVLAVCLSAAPAASASGLIIAPTFDTSITSNPNAAAIEGAIDSAIGEPAPG